MNSTVIGILLVGALILLVIIAVAVL